MAGVAAGAGHAPPLPTALRLTVAVRAPPAGAAAGAIAPPPPQAGRVGRRTSCRRRRIGGRRLAAEGELTRLGLRKNHLELAMGDPAVQANFVELRRVTSELADIDVALAAAEDAWLELEERRAVTVPDRADRADRLRQVHGRRLARRAARRRRSSTRTRSRARCSIPASRRSTPSSSSSARTSGATDGTLDRAALGRIVFADPEALRDLEAIVHPAVRPRILAAIAAAEADAADAVVIEAIKLVEGGLAEVCDEVWLVICDAGVQRERLVARGSAARGGRATDRPGAGRLLERAWGRRPPGRSTRRPTRRDPRAWSRPRSTPCRRRIGPSTRSGARTCVGQMTLTARDARKHHAELRRRRSRQSPDRPAPAARRPA